MRAFDASSMIYAWDNYPIDQFPGLWEWIAEQVGAQQICMPDVALDEVLNKVPECCAWLKENGLLVIPIGNAAVREAMRIKDLLGIEGDKYHPKGVGENDIFIIATARLQEIELVSDEERQQVAPQVESKRKIPSVCGIPDVNVRCINFLDYIKNSGAVFR